MPQFLVTFGAFFGVIIAITLIKIYNIRANKMEKREFLRQITVGSFLYNPQDWR